MLHCATAFLGSAIGQTSERQAIVGTVGGSPSAWRKHVARSGIQLKQYTFDVMLALVPFLIEDGFFERSLIRGERSLWLVCLAAPCAVSYTYPIALGARIIGWYVDHGRRAGWRLKPSAVAAVIGASFIALLSIWLRSPV